MRFIQIDKKFIFSVLAGTCCLGFWQSAASANEARMQTGPSWPSVGDRRGVLPIIAQAAIGKTEQDGSLDSMWMDQPEPESSKTEPLKNENSVNEKPLARSVNGSGMPSVGGVSNAVAPMCTFTQLKESQMVAKGAWPGLGPFKVADAEPNVLVDPNDNRLSVSLSGDQITKAELDLKEASGPPRDFLDMEMSADFLLEALGARARKIVDFNNQLEKNKDMLALASPLDLTAGRYLVTIDKKGKSAYKISVNSLDASREAIRTHSGTEVKEPEPKADPTPNAVKSTAKQVPAAVKRPAEKRVETTINPSIDSRKEQFANAIRSWQNIKKVAVRKRDASEISSILAGKALIKQTDAVKWLTTNKKYYEMTPKGVVVDKYLELIPGKKYSVVAQVREASKFIDEQSNQVLKEADDRYTVNYTIEKINDKWMISDSALLQASANPSAAKSTSQKR